MRIKGSGTDLRTIGADGFPGLHLDQLRPLRERAAMSDEEMVAFLDGCMTEPDARKPSIETLLHGFLPAAHVDHVHADAICTLTNHPDGGGPWPRRWAPTSRSFPTSARGSSSPS